MEADLQLVIACTCVGPCGSVCDVMVEWNVVSGAGSVWSDCVYLQLCTHMYMSFDLSLSVCAPSCPPSSSGGHYLYCQ